MANLTSALTSDPRWKRAVELPQINEETGLSSLKVPELNGLLLNGLARGVLLEASGARSTGKTAICLYILAQATQRGEVCAVVDLHNSFHPDSASVSGVQLDRVVWVRCKSNVEYTMRAADLLLHVSGFGVVLLDLSKAAARSLNRIPLSYWYRFQRVVKTPPQFY